MSNRPKQRPSTPLPGTTARGGPNDRAGAPGASGGGAPRAPGGAAGGRSTRTGWLIGGIIAVIVVVAAAIAIASSSSDDDDVSSAGTTGAAAAEHRPVTVTGSPLPEGTEGALSSQVPVLTGQTFDGAPITIGAPGRATLVAFVAHWCPHCQREVPRLVDWSRSGQVPADLDVVAVATATTDSRDNYPPSAWLEREAWPWPVLVDDEESTAANAYGVSGFPFFALYDADGKLVLRTSGELDTDELGPMISAALGR